MKYNKGFLFLLIFWMVNGAAFAQDEAPAPSILVDKIVAKVDNKVILKSDVEMGYLSYLSSGRRDNPDLKCQILGQLISDKLMVAKAEIDSVLVSEIEVESNLSRRIQILMSQYGGSELEIEKFYGKPLEAIKNEIRDELRDMLTAQRMQEHITKNITVTPSDVRRFFNRIPRDSLPFFSKEVTIGQIVKFPEVSPEKKLAARQLLMDLREKVLAGGDFAIFAMEHSEDGSARYGGDLGFVSRGTMVPEFEAAALRLKPGEISMPIESRFGIHLIQLLERRGNEYHSRHILKMPTATEKEIAVTRKFLDSLRTEILEERVTFRDAAKEHTDDKATGPSGGYLMDDMGSDRVAVDELDPVIYFALDSMKVGEISPPFVFKTEDGKEALKILYYKSNLPPHMANLKDDWQKIQFAALNEKKSKELYEWFDKARHDVFISIAPEYDRCDILD